MKLRGKLLFVLILFLPFLICSILCVIIYKPQIDFIADTNYILTEITDKSDNGNSYCTVKKNDSNVLVSYTLQNKYEYPYAGLQINYKKGFYSVMGYNAIIVIHAEQDCRVSLRINQYINNYSDTSKPLTLMIYVKKLVFKKGENRFRINMNNIEEVPDWWFKSNPMITNEEKEFSKDKIKNIWLFSEFSTPLNQNISFKVQELKLTYNYMPFLLWSIALSCIYYFLLFIVWKFKKEKTQYIFMPIEKINVNDKTPKQQTEILTYIGSNFTNPDLKLNDVAQHLGISQDTVSDILKRYCNKSFRQYLNHIRMEEAKRLLKESNLQISEIAFKVGYNNIQHFNRVFKEFTEESPKNFREK